MCRFVVLRPYHETLTTRAVGYAEICYVRHTCTILTHADCPSVVPMWLIAGILGFMILSILAVLRLVGSERAERTDRIVRRKKQRETDRLTRVPPPAAEQPGSNPG